MRDSMVWYDKLRYRLMPYIYTMAADTYYADGTIMRGLVMDFPHDDKVKDISDEYMFGHALPGRAGDRVRRARAHRLSSRRAPTGTTSIPASATRAAAASTPRRR